MTRAEDKSPTQPTKPEGWEERLSACADRLLDKWQPISTLAAVYDAYYEADDAKKAFATDLTTALATIEALRAEIAALKGGTEQELGAAKVREDLACSYDPTAFSSGFSDDWNKRAPRRQRAYAAADSELRARAALGESHE